MRAPPAAGAVALACVLASCGGGAASTSAGSPASGLLAVPVAGAPQRGLSDAWVTLVEFADFQCRFCRAEAPVVDEVAAGYGADLRVVFRHLPLDAIHPDARRAAVAAECAHDQGRFWELHDLLLVSALDAGAIAEAARHVPGLDVAAWQACLDGTAAADRVEADVALAARLGIQGTPTFVVNGVEVVGAVPANELRAAIDRARDTAVSSGIPRAEYYDRAVLGNP